jgi:CheY-like chemotaxis protein
MTPHHGSLRADRRVVLVVDDDDDLRRTLCDVLTDEGFETVGVPDGAAALAYLERSPLPAAILLDLMMPNMDGWMFRERQLGDPRLAKIPVVVMTAHRNQSRRPVGGAPKILYKPMLHIRVIEALEDVCDGPSDGEDEALH